MWSNLCFEHISKTNLSSSLGHASCHAISLCVLPCLLPSYPSVVKHLFLLPWMRGHYTRFMYSFLILLL